MQPCKFFENDLTFPIQLMAPMFPSDPIQDDDVHYILLKKKKNEPFQIHRTTKQAPNL